MKQANVRPQNCGSCLKIADRAKARQRAKSWHREANSALIEAVMAILREKLRCSDSEEMIVMEKSTRGADAVLDGLAKAKARKRNWWSTAYGCTSATGKQKAKTIICENLPRRANGRACCQVPGADWGQIIEWLAADRDRSLGGANATHEAFELAR